MKKKHGLMVVGIVFVILFVLGRYSGLVEVIAETPDEVSMRLTSLDFEHNGAIPSQFTCEGKDISPRLGWSNAPAGTQSFVLIVDDPDAPDPKAPKMTWVHWVVFNIPASVASFAAGETMLDSQLAVNDFGNKTQKKYGGPCPPIGEHRYFFKVYALDTMLDQKLITNKESVLQAMQGHILAQAELVGLYRKK